MCDFCGRSSGETGDRLPLTWSTARERGQDKVFCPECSREHLRAMEAKLDSEWW